MEDPVRVSMAEDMLNDIIKKWNTLGDITKSCLATVIYTWFVCGFLSMVSVIHSWILFPVIITVMFGYHLSINADKW